MVYDLIVIGGGMSGISVGHYFRNHSILILEKGDLLQEASGNNAGFLIAGFGEHYNRTAARWGRLRAREIQQIHLTNHRQIQELTKRLDCIYSKQGSLAVALTEKEGADLLESSRIMSQEGFPVEWQEASGTGLRHNNGALFNPDDGWIDASQFWRRLAHGLPVVTQCAVCSTKDLVDCISVQTTRGEFLCRRVVFCLNAFAAGLVPELNGRYIPLRGQMVELPLRKAGPGRWPIYANYGEIYWRFGEESLSFGGLECRVPEDEVGITTGISMKIQEEQLYWIHEHFEEDMIALQPLRSWYSTMAFTIDGFPFVGELPRKNHYVLSGLCGLGHSYALVCASWLHELITTNHDIIPSYFRAGRVSDLPVYSGGNWRTLYEAWNH